MLLISQIQNLVFSGGGQRGFAYVGALEALQTRGLVLANLNGVGGASIGALFSMLLCAGYTPGEMEQEMYALDIYKIVDFNITTLFQDYGLDDGRRLQKLLGKYLKQKQFKATITFREMYALTRMRLVVMGCNINTYDEYIMSHETTPDMRVADACHMSMCLPLLFSPIKHRNALYMDGGIVNNFPMQHFPANNTLGFRLNWGVAFQINTIDQFIARLAYCALGQSEYIQWLKLEDAHKLNTITIDVGDVSTVNLHMATAHKVLIVNKGKISVLEAFAEAAAVSAASFTHPQVVRAPTPPPNHGLVPPPDRLVPPWHFPSTPSVVPQPQPRPPTETETINITPDTSSLITTIFTQLMVTLSWLVASRSVQEDEAPKK